MGEGRLRQRGHRKEGDATCQGRPKMICRFVPVMLQRPGMENMRAGSGIKQITGKAGGIAAIVAAAHEQPDLLFRKPGAQGAQLAERRGRGHFPSGSPAGCPVPRPACPTAASRAAGAAAAVRTTIPRSSSGLQYDNRGCRGSFMRDGYMDMAHAQLPGTLQGRAGKAQLRFARRRGQDLDVTWADPQAEAAAQRLDGGFLGSPASLATKAGRSSGQASCSAGARILAAKRAPWRCRARSIRPISVRSIPSPTSMSAPGVEAQEKKRYTAHSIDLF